MSTNLTVAGRLQLAGYAGTAAGILRSRVHPLIAVSVVDILAVALGLGALYVAGVMVTGSHPAQFIASETTVGNAAAVAAPAVAPAARIAPKVAAAKTPDPAQKAPTARPTVVYAALPTDEVLFSDPVYIGGEVAPGEYACSFQNCVDHFVTPVDIATAEEPAIVAPAAAVASVDDTAHAPVDKIISISGVARGAAQTVAKTAATATNALPVAVAAGSRDGVTVKADTPVASAAAGVGGGNIGATVGAGDTSVSAYTSVGETVAPAVQAVTDAAAPVAAPVSQAVSGVTGLLN